MINFFENLYIQIACAQTGNIYFMTYISNIYLNELTNTICTVIIYYYSCKHNYFTFLKIGIEYAFLTISLPPATKLGQGNIFRSVCQEFCPQGGVWADTPRGVDTHPPPGSRHPQEQCMLGDMGNKRTVRMLLECIRVLLFVSLKENIK